MLSRLRDPFSAISHWLGFFLSVAATFILCSLSAGKSLHIIGFLLYGFGASALYLASASYHSFHGKGWWEKGLQKLDHAGIYLMIWGSYVPVCLVALKGAWGNGLLLAQTLFALTGVILTFVLPKVPGKIRVILYVGMGWMSVVALGQMRAVWPPQALYWLFGEGALFTIGAGIYISDRPHLVPGKFTAHDLWHVFVLAGSVCHFILLLGYVVPMS